MDNNYMWPSDSGKGVFIPVDKCWSDEEITEFFNLRKDISHMSFHFE